MRTTLLLALILLAACGDDPNESKPAYSMDGAWTLHDSLAGVINVSGDPTPLAFMCKGSTTATLEDVSGTISGTRSGILDCEIDGFTDAWVDFEGALDGTRSGKAVSMAEDFGWACTYTGTMKSEKAVSGTMQCSYSGEDGTLTGTGTWKGTHS